MGINLFDFFTFKKDAAKIFTKENIQGLLDTARNSIIEQVEKNLAGYEKKEIVDKTVITLIYERVAKANIKNKVVLWIVDQIAGYIPNATQYIYDLLKENVHALTKEK